MFLFLFSIPVTLLCTVIWFDINYFFYARVDMSSDKNKNLITEKSLMETSRHVKNKSLRKHYNKKKEDINRKCRLLYKENSEQINKQRRERHGHSFADVIDSQGKPTKFQSISDIMRRSNIQSQFLSSMPTYKDNCNEKLNEINEPFVNHSSNETFSNHGIEV